MRDLLGGDNLTNGEDMLACRQMYLCGSQLCTNNEQCNMVLLIVRENKLFTLSIYAQ